MKLPLYLFGALPPVICSPTPPRALSGYVEATNSSPICSQQPEKAPGTIAVSLADKAGEKFQPLANEDCGILASFPIFNGCIYKDCRKCSCDVRCALPQLNSGEDIVQIFYGEFDDGDDDFHGTQSFEIGILKSEQNNNRSWAPEVQNKNKDCEYNTNGSDDGHDSESKDPAFKPWWWDSYMTPQDPGEPAALTGPQLKNFDLDTIHQATDGEKNSTSNLITSGCPLMPCTREGNGRCGIMADCFHGFCKCALMSSKGTKGPMGKSTNIMHSDSVLVNPGVDCSAKCKDWLCPEVSQNISMCFEDRRIEGRENGDDNAQAGVLGIENQKHGAIQVPGLDVNLGGPTA
ncbi:hypothetical protein CC78DRAFT_103053 [Lojkania enalia]|uniref:Uncharacterized protein n=1 Tax=Lojkania enalia TaxID=147567 RepID=A0A9P4KE71_9PLEO|nr:hypothetical protein CC78DRAFT_103053 [Didymosphaeria enalia]